MTETETETELSDLQIHVNGQQTFFLHERIISKFSGRLRKMIKQEKRKTLIRNSGVEIHDLPGGPEGFELISRFCYNGGSIAITVLNVSLLHCCALFLAMTEKASPCNLLRQTEVFLQGIFYWSWNDIIVSLKSCESFFLFADSCGLIEKLMSSLLAKIAQNSDTNFPISSSSSSSSSSPSPETVLFRPSASSKPLWWFDDLTILPPKIIEKFIKTLGAFVADNNNNNNNNNLTKFLLHYLKTASQSTKLNSLMRSDYGGLADSAAHGVVLMGKSSFSCRGLFWVLRIVSGFGVSKECRLGLERLIGGVLDQATLDDLLVCNHDKGGVYDINLVLRLTKLFIHDDEKIPIQRMKKVGKLIDKYLGEISPDQNLKISKFLGVAESLPDFARDCFDGVYRAIDIYLESHPSLSMEERSRLCRCLNYEKLSLEACKDLAKNPRIPPRIAVQALSSQYSNISSPSHNNNVDHEYYSLNTNDQMMMMMISSTSCTKSNNNNNHKNSGNSGSSSSSSYKQMVLYSGENDDDGHEEMRLNLERMQWRVVELERACRDIKGQVSKMVKTNSRVMSTPVHTRALPRLC